MNPFSGGLPNFMPQTPVINPAAQQITSKYDLFLWNE